MYQFFLLLICISGYTESKLLDIPPQIQEVLNPSVLEWKPPAGFKERFPYYLSGHTEDGKPIWIVEFGNWRTVDIAERGGALMENFEKYIQQFAGVISQSAIASLGENDVLEPNVYAIVDLKDYPLSEMASPLNLQFIVRMFGKYIRNGLLFDLIEKGYLVNANFVAEAVINLLRPVLGAFLERIDIYGSNKDRWLPVVTRELPRDQIPAWYGGKGAGYKPLKVFG